MNLRTWTTRLVMSLVGLTGCGRYGFDAVDAVGTVGRCVGGNGASLVGPFTVCLDEGVPAFEPKVSLSTGTTGSDLGDCTEVVVQTDIDQTEVCVIAAPTILINNPLAITGTRPLVFAAAGELTILVDLDLASHSLPNPGIVGPGATNVGCPALNGVSSAVNSTGSGGGAGGTFGSIGGDGGAGTVAGATAVAPLPLAFVHGGCNGGRGGSGAGSGAGGPGGRAGGALYLIAGTTLRIAGTINASGAAGFGGGKSSPNSHTSGGGGGGGSGGLIGMDAPEVILEASARLIANGGGGGGGGGGGSPAVTTTLGVKGSEASLIAPAPFQALGGAGGFDGAGAGGRAADRDTAPAAGADQVTTGGGGGGGGGLGLISVYATTLTDHGAIASPPVTRP